MFVLKLEKDGRTFFFSCLVSTISPTWMGLTPQILVARGCWVRCVVVVFLLLRERCVHPAVLDGDCAFYAVVVGVVDVVQCWHPPGGSCCAAAR